MTEDRDFLSFRNVELRYAKEKPILKNVNFSLTKGSFHFLTGPSGSGKSSLLKLIYLGHRHYQGTIKLFYRDTRHIETKDIPAFRQRIGVVFQEGNLLDHLNVIDNVALPLRVRGIPRAKAYEHAEEMLDWVSLHHHLKSPLHHLSGGERQRVVIARSVMNSPDILLADEPTGNVDDAVAIKIMKLFEKLNSFGATILLATHNRDLFHEFQHPILEVRDQSLHALPPVGGKDPRRNEQVQNA